MSDKEKGQSAEDKLILETLDILKRKRVVDLEHSLAQILQNFPEVVEDARRLRELRGKAPSWERLPDQERAEANEISMKYMLNGNLDGLKKPKGKLFAYAMNLIQQVQTAKMGFK